MTKAEYQEYLKSEHWKQVKEQYRRSRIKKRCVVCETQNILHLHHITYKRLYRERRQDLIYLCETCHEKVHVLLRENKGKNVTLSTAAKILRGNFLKQGAGVFGLKLTKPKSKLIINTVTPTHLPPVIAPSGEFIGFNYGYKIAGLEMRGSRASADRGNQGSRP